MLAALALLRRHLEPQWTREVPKEEGWWWWTNQGVVRCYKIKRFGPDHFLPVETIQHNLCSLESIGGLWMKANTPPLPAPANQESA